MKWFDNVSLTLVIVGAVNYFCHNELCMIFVVFNIENANAGSLTYTSLLGRERESEPKGRRSNRTAGR